MTIWFTTSKLINKAQDGVEKHEELQLQFLHASKLAAVGELATGVAHEIDNPLAIIMASSGVIRDMLDPEFDLDGSPENIRPILYQQRNGQGDRPWFECFVKHREVNGWID